MTLVSIDIDYYADDLSNQALIDEVKVRISNNQIKPTDIVGLNDPEPWCPSGLAADVREAFYRRDASRMEMLLMVLERQEKAT